MQPGAVLFLHLFNGLNLPAKTSELDKFLMSGLQSLLPLDVFEHLAHSGVECGMPDSTPESGRSRPLVAQSFREEHRGDP
jgi:hypothetical protein